MLELLNPSWQLGIALVGTAASLSSVFLAEPNLRSRALHIIYSAAILTIIFLMTSFTSRLEVALADANTVVEQTKIEIAEIEKIRNRADAIYQRMYTGVDPGANAGNILLAFSFLKPTKKDIQRLM